MAREFQVGDRVKTTRIIPTAAYKVTRKTTIRLPIGTMATFAGCEYIEDGEPLFMIELDDGTLILGVDEASIAILENV